MKTILWIDDDKELMDESSAVFKRHGFHIIQATTPSTALKSLRQCKDQLDGVLLDVRLGGGENGLELLEELSHIHTAIKVVVFTAYPDYSDQVDAKVAGVLAYFEKVDKSIPLAPDKQISFFESLHRLFPDRSNAEVKSKKSEIDFSEEDISLWIRGIFFLVAFIVIAAVITIVAKSISPWVLPLVLVVAILFYTIVCAFLLKTQPKRGISEKGFLFLMKESLSLLPKLLAFKRKPHEERTENVAPEDTSDESPLS